LDFQKELLINRNRIGIGREKTVVKKYLTLKLSIPLNKPFEITTLNGHNC
jgi:hypothetical protein